MKKYHLSLIALICVSSGMMLVEGKFEDAIDAIDRQDLARLRKALIHKDGIIPLTPTQFERLIDEATQIYEKRAQELTIFTDKKDAAMKIIGSVLLYSCAWSLVHNIAVWRGWVDVVLEEVGHPIIYDAWGHGRVTTQIIQRPLTNDERPRYWPKALWSAVWAGLWGYMAIKGSQCENGSIPVENARLIVEAIKKAQSRSSDT